MTYTITILREDMTLNMSQKKWSFIYFAKQPKSTFVDRLRHPTEVSHICANFFEWADRFESGD